LAASIIVSVHGLGRYHAVVRSERVKFVPVIAAAVGLTAIGALVVHFDADAVIRSLVAIGWGGFLAICLIHLALIAVMSLSNAASAGRLIVDLVRAEGIRDPAQLLLTGAAIWLTNVIVFGLWYWEFDRGGPVERAAGVRPYPDFTFPQMTSPELAPPSWEPGFVDYLYMSFTNAMAFSPTDVMPMTRWAKLTMLAQSLISVVTVALVIARAVNILK